MTTAQHVIVMGVAGSGKSSVATLLAEQLGWVLAEGDEFHPQANIDKMSAGQPLDDDDRQPFLEAIRDWVRAKGAEGVSTIVTCSALKRSYRDVLREAGPVRFAHLTGDVDTISERMEKRTDHFMPPSLLASQFATLEQLDDDEDGMAVSIDGTLEEITGTIVESLRLEASPAADARES
ncbi:gluconokinase [Demequina muriae]|uniref:Gluconokinase n=1 Tax=Demequina muriae TaxID=3051664 RepID=A0ABT8GDE9_9MICO|nr:gluconokinase [Demequina sp. EGI L300058]MDN4479456.1 gluconokinase [Demequina sp. EGI L300058]